MTGLEPHPIFWLPTKEQAEKMGAARLQELARIRAEKMMEERNQPLERGFRPEIWNIVDDLLLDGNKVVLDLTRIARISPEGVAPLVADVPKEIMGRPEIWIAGANRSSKSEYGGNKLMRVLRAGPRKRTWSFADTGPISVARQQPIFWKYLPAELKKLAGDTGKIKRGGTLSISYTQKGGFTEQTFVLPNASQHWFKNYEQHLANVEGDQLDAIWLDELRNIELLRTLRGRTIDRAGIIIVTFTAIDENYSAIVNEYERGARTILEVDAELLPIKRPKNLSGGERQPRSGDASLESSGHIKGSNESSIAAAQTISAGDNKPRHKAHTSSPIDGETKEPDEPGSPAEKILPVPVLAEPTEGAEDQCLGGKARESTIGLSGKTPDSRGGQNEFEVIGYKKVPRIKIAGPGTDGNQQANIVYFHITDNPYFGYDGAMARTREGGIPLFGKDRFYRAYRGATEAKIKSRVYGILQAGSAQQFPKFNDLWHVVEPGQVPAEGSNYHVVDPCPGRNWFMVWIRIDNKGRWFVYREWPSTGHKGSYIPGIGDPGPWALPGQPADGVRGSAQQPFGFGLDRYMREILRNEGAPDAQEEAPREEKTGGEILWGPRPKNPLGKARGPQRTADPTDGREKILERWMDSRYGNSPTQTKEGSTTLIEQMDDLGMQFLAASGKEIDEGTGLVNDLLDYDPEVDRGKYSPLLARANEPKLFVSRNCPNVIYALREWTGKDKQHGACKDPADTLRYAALAGLEYIGENSYAWSGGGSY